MFFNIKEISKGREFALKFIDSLPLRSLETIHPIVLELLQYIEKKIEEKIIEEVYAERRKK